MGLFREWLEGMTATAISSMGTDMRDFEFGTSVPLMVRRPSLYPPMEKGPMISYRCNTCGETCEMPPGLPQPSNCPKCCSLNIELVQAIREWGGEELSGQFKGRYFPAPSIMPFTRWIESPPLRYDPNTEAYWCSNCTHTWQSPKGLGGTSLCPRCCSSNFIMLKEKKEKQK